MPNNGQNDSSEIEERRLALEEQKLSVQNSLEERKLQLEERRLRQMKRNTFITGLIGTLVTVLIPTSFGFYQWTSGKAETERVRIVEEKRAAQKSSERKQETIIQLINAREAADTDLRARMFNSLLQHYFKQRDYRTQIAILELIGLNFRDSVQIKPMFEMLDAEFKTLIHHRDKNSSTADLPRGNDLKRSQENSYTGAPPTGTSTYTDTQVSDIEKLNELRTMLREAAQEIIRDQLDQIQQAEQGHVCELKLTKSKPESPECFTNLKLELTQVSKDQSKIRIRTNTNKGMFLPPGSNEDPNEFSVTHFDMPMLDYTTVQPVSGDFWKYAIVIRKIHKDNSVTIAVATLPQDSYSTRHEYKFDEMLMKYLE